jgi:GT2 family glycosyltransferase
LFEGKQGSSHARNLALLEARAEIIVFTDDDVLGDAAWLRKLVEVFTLPGNENVGVVGGEVFHIYPDGLPAWVAGYYRPFGYRKDIGPLKPGQLPSTANVAIRKKVLDQVGGFRTDLGRLPNRLTGGEDLDLMRRIRSAGYDLWYHPGASLQHVVPGGRLTLRYISKFCYDSSYSRVIERRGSARFWAWVFSRILVYALSVPLSLAISGLCLLVRQRGRAKRWLTRAAKGAGYIAGSFYVIRCVLTGRKPGVS